MVCKLVNSIPYENNLYKKAYAFALKIIRLYRFLGEEKQEFILSKQLVKSGTSIGANIAEANGAVTKADFSFKLSIAYKECLEAKYWLSLLKETGLINQKEFDNLHNDAVELGRIIYTIQKKVKK